MLGFFIILTFRVGQVKIFLERLDESALKPGLLVNVKVVYFTRHNNLTDESIELLGYLDEYQNKYPDLKFQLLPADGEFSRGKGKNFIELTFCFN